VDLRVTVVLFAGVGLVSGLVFVEGLLHVVERFVVGVFLFEVVRVELVGVWSVRSVDRLQNPDCLILRRSQVDKRAQIRTLLAFSAQDAGGLMHAGVVCVADGAAVVGFCAADRLWD